MTIDQLAKSYLCYLERWRKRPECTGPGAQYWECCDYHRNLFVDAYRYKELAKKFNVISEGEVLSATWWRDAGRPDLMQSIINCNIYL